MEEDERKMRRRKEERWFNRTGGSNDVKEGRSDWRIKRFGEEKSHR